MAEIMIATTEERVFGKPGEPGVQEHLPRSFVTLGEYRF